MSFVTEPITPSIEAAILHVRIAQSEAAAAMADYNRLEVEKAEARVRMETADVALLEAQSKLYEEVIKKPFDQTIQDQIASISNRPQYVRLADSPTEPTRLEEGVDAAWSENGPLSDEDRKLLLAEKEAGE